MSKHTYRRRYGNYRKYNHNKFASGVFVSRKYNNNIVLGTCRYYGRKFALTEPELSPVVFDAFLFCCITPSQIK